MQAYISFHISIFQRQEERLFPSQPSIAAEWQCREEGRAVPVRWVEVD